MPQRVSGAAESLDERLDRLTADVVRVLDRLDVIEALVRGSHDSPAAVGDDDERPLPTTPRVPPLSIAGEMSGPASNALFGE